MCDNAAIKRCPAQYRKKKKISLVSPRGGSGSGSLGGAQQLTGGGSSRNFPRPPEAGPIQWGEGRVVADILRGLQKPARFSGGGGIVADIFRVSSPETARIRSRERL